MYDMLLIYKKENNMSFLDNREIGTTIVNEQGNLVTIYMKCIKDKVKIGLRNGFGESSNEIVLTQKEKHHLADLLNQCDFVKIKQ